jgi:hypothetical protein
MLPCCHAANHLTCRYSCSWSCKLHLHPIIITSPAAALLCSNLNQHLLQPARPSSKRNLTSTLETALAPGPRAACSVSRQKKKDNKSPKLTTLLLSTTLFDLD